MVFGASGGDAWFWGLMLLAMLASVTKWLGKKAAGNASVRRGVANGLRSLFKK